MMIGPEGRWNDQCGLEKDSGAVRGEANFKVTK